MNFVKGINTIIILLLILGCGQSNQKNALQIRNDYIKQQVTINIQPFADIQDGDIQFAYKQLKMVYPFVNLKLTIQLPQSAYYKERNRYRADSLIIFLNKQTPKQHVTIGLTSKDISINKNNNKDWGIMGLGFCPGKACIASTYRLSKENKQSQFYKVAIHELGHTQGLPHCPIDSCFMQDAEGGNPTNKETCFCEKCKKILATKGWKFE